MDSTQKRQRQKRQPTLTERALREAAAMVAFHNAMARRQECPTAKAEIVAIADSRLESMGRIRERLARLEVRPGVVTENMVMRAIESLAGGR